ncbi:hypothetical protein GOB46_09170 [Sinorhizobium meliloti]|uniref:hypothetical protein n=1 Tax=Rhizobium meliloti TaxID=382 RepID=UPI000FD7DAA0|nr:hypothetical protein [Sinorhizobium meliloti]MDW9852755.1 hypothetical protein [Sinorhizobium meliloti]MDW9870949.1 hypothetical protein [Sinorhizobium meliloti]MDW9883930.1 hypothetical protein [Sinorhizobium meliloti]MDX0205810.1 hypothetical protein [Sinorhizobium meliloti]RVH74167.1 hypothetical protein CN203_23970 [Sinorhizobium meliloti]
MTFTIELTQVVSKEVKYLQAECGVRYWEDGEVNGTEDTDGELMPLRVKDAWCPTIDLETGAIQDWPAGTTANIHYKVCDAGLYKLLDAEKKVVREIDGYVPTMMSPGGSGYGDYVIMTIGPDGKIENWSVDLEPFQEDGE